MGETSYEGDLDDPVAEGGSDDEGNYAEPGGYTNPDGTTGYSGLSSEIPDAGDESGDYPASLGATIAVTGGLAELAGGALVSGLVAGEATADFLDGLLFGLVRGAEVDDLIWGE
jgi:hypothetical protein